MQVLLSLIVLLGINAWMVCLFRREFGKVLPLTMLSVTLIMVVFAVADMLPLGVSVIKVLGLMAYIMIGVGFFFAKERLRVFADKYFSLGFWLFLLVFAFVFVVDYGRKIQNWDEIAYWSLRVKEMVRLDRLYNVPESLIPIHRDYPPFLACFQYFWCKMNGGFHDRWMYMGTHLLEISMLIPCVEYFAKGKSKQNILNVFLTFVLIVAMGLIVDIEDAAMMFKSIYSDAFMAILSAYLLFFVFMNQQTDWFFRLNMCLGFIGLLLAKPSGLGFFIIIVIFMLVNQLQMYKNEKSGSDWRKLIVTVLGAAIVPYLCYRVWEWYVVALGVNRQFDPEENRNLLQFVQIFLGNGESYQTVTIENYIKSVIAEPLLQRPIKLVWWQIFLLTIVLFEIAVRVIGNQEIGRRLRLLNIISACSAIGYMFYMCMLYVFSFDSVEATELASFRRYLNTYWMFIWNALILIFIAVNAEKEHKKGSLLWGLAALIWIGFVDPDEVKKIVPVAPRISCSVLSEHVREEESVYVLQDEFDHYALTFMRYTIWPQKVDSGCSIEIKDQLSREDFNDILSEYEYLYIQDPVYELFEDFDMAPSNGELFESQSLYKIMKKDSEIEFEFIGKE